MANENGEQVEAEVLEATPAWSEAPASMNIRFRMSGFDVLLTLRYGSEGIQQGSKLVAALPTILEGLYKKGAQPIANSYSSSPKPKAEAKAEEEGEEREDWCSIHDCALPEWTSKDGKRKWRSHKIDGTDEWCKGK